MKSRMHRRQRPGRHIACYEVETALNAGACSICRLGLLAVQATYLRALSSKLSEYIRKQDYRFQGEPRGRRQARHGGPWRTLSARRGCAVLTVPNGRPAEPAAAGRGRPVMA